MKRVVATFSALALMVFASGCCCHHLHGGGCAPPPCPPPCGPCGVNYGGYPAYSQAYVQTGVATAALPTTGFVTASAPACDCGPGSPAISPY